LKSDGTVVGWGDNDQFQLDPPPSAHDLTAISAGGLHSLALRRDGTVVAWGDDLFGQSTVPAGLKDVVAISAGFTHSVALKRDGTVVSWGGIEDFGNGLSSCTVPQGLAQVGAITAGLNSDVYAVIYAPVLVGGVAAHDLTNGTALLSATARGRQPMTYQWRLNGKNIANGTDSQLQVVEPTSSAAAARLKYDVVVHNAFGTATSAVAVLPVQAPAPITGSPTVIPIIIPVYPILPGTNGGDLGLVMGTIGSVGPRVWTNGLQVTRGGAGVTLTWPNGAVLESTDDLSHGFSPETGSALSAGAVRIMAVTPNATQRFYRLKKN
jgi:hypothetical protein